MLIQILVLLLVVFLIKTYLIGFYHVPSGSMETTMLDGERFIGDKFTPYFRDFQRGDVIVFNEPLYTYSTNPVVKLWQRYIWGPSNWTKRVIGLPGEHIQGIVEEGKPVVYVNGKKLDEPYINKYPLIYTWKSTPQAADLVSGDRIVPKSFDPENYNKFYTIDPALIVHTATSEPYILKPGTPQPFDVFDIHLGPDEFWAMGDNRLGSYDSRGWGPLKRERIHGRVLFRIFSWETSHGWLFVDMIRHPIDFWKRVRWSRCMNTVS